MANRVLALGLTMALAATAACGDDSGDKLPGDGSVPGADGGPAPGTDGGPAPGTDGGPMMGLDGGPLQDGGPGTDGGPSGPGTKVITAAGGAVTSSDGRVTLTFSRYAYKRPVNVSIMPATSPPAGARGTVYNLAPTTEAFTEQNNSIVTVTLTYSAADLGGGSPQDLKIGQYLAGKWVELKPADGEFNGFATKANPSNMTITAKIQKLAPVALLGGLCVECPATACTAVMTSCSYVANPGANPQPGKCVALPAGSSCLACRPQADDDNDGSDTDDCAPANPKVRPGLPELCNGVDDNCNAHVDEGCTPCASDGDCKASRQWCRNGFCDTQDCGQCDPAMCFTGPQEAQVPGRCQSFGANNTCGKCVAACDTDGDGQCPTAADPNQVDCAEGNPSVYRGAPEICGNNVDDNCDAHIDENCNTCTSDADCPVDGLVCVGGACQACAAACDPATCAYNGTPGTCQAYGKGCSRCINVCDTDKDGYCGAAGQDCQEGNNPAVNQGALEVCGNSVDDNCDGHIDEGCNACNTHADCAGFPEYCNPSGACDVCPQTQCDQAGCVWPAGQALTTPTVPGKCQTYAKGCARCGPPEGSDADGDGFLSQVAVDAAKAQVPSVDLLMGNPAQRVDCDDTVATTNPGAPEICGNTKDDDCDGLADELCVTCETSMICGAASICNNSR